MVHLPQYAWLAITNRCNLRCRWCFAKEHQSDPSQLTVADIHTLVDTLDDLGVRDITFAGGEPTLHPDLPDMIRYAKARSFFTYVITNGLRLGTADLSYARSLAASGVDRISISLKGGTEEDYHSCTGAPALQTVLNAIANLVELGHPPNLMVTLSPAITPNLIGLLPKLERLGVTSVDYSFCVPPMNNGRMTADDTLTAAHLLGCLHVAYRATIATSMRCTFNCNLPLCLIDPKLLDGDKATFRNGCPMPHGLSLNIGANGAIHPCNHFTSASLGTLTEHLTDAETFRTFWSSPDIQEFRASTRKYPSPKCIDCPRWTQCGGGCVLRWLAHDPEEFIPGLQQPLPRKELP